MCPILNTYEFSMIFILYDVLLLFQVVKSIDPVEYGEYLSERKLVVERQLQELKELKESKMLRA